MTGKKTTNFVSCSTIMCIFADLFTQAIMMAGSDLSEWAVIPTADSIEYSQRLAYEVGCPTSDNQRLIDCLRYSRSYNEIVNASARVVMLVRVTLILILIS
jgi:hypothetical protein